jgi:hypothetical protein
MLQHKQQDKKEQQKAMIDKTVEKEKGILQVN